jgi:hypothetical protein
MTSIPEKCMIYDHINLVAIVAILFVKYRIFTLQTCVT